MKLTVSLIDHGKPREAIPVRAIPLLTDQFISADLISMALAGADCSFRPGLTAYIESEGDALQIPEADWFLILEQLQALDASLPYGAAGKYEWRHRSIAEIPAKAFVWADEFSDAYRKSFNNAIHLELSEGERLHANGEVRIPMVVSDQLRRVALEGFPEIRLGVVTAPTSNNPVVPDSPKTQTICDEGSLCAEEKDPSAPAASTHGIHVNDTKKRRHTLDDAIDRAIELDGYVYQTVWARLKNWALSTEKTFSDLIGFVDEGIQYRGKKHQNNGEYDILTYKQLSERIRKRKNKSHPKPL